MFFVLIAVPALIALIFYKKYLKEDCDELFLFGTLFFGIAATVILLTFTCFSISWVYSKHFSYPKEYEILRYEIKILNETKDTVMQQSKALKQLENQQTSDQFGLVSQIYLDKMIDTISFSETKIQNMKSNLYKEIANHNAFSEFWLLGIGYIKSAPEKYPLICTKH